MIITMTGAPCSGKTTVAKALSSKYGFDRISTGNLVREMAEERGIDIVKMQEVLNSDPTIDQEIERRQQQMGIDRADDNLIMEARLAWFVVPHSFKVFVTIPEEEMARRFVADGARQNDVKTSSVKEAGEALKYRFSQEVERFKKTYGVDFTDMSNFDYVAVNYGKTPEQTADEIYQAYTEFVKNNKTRKN